MSRKTDKLSSLIRNTVGEAILTKLSDPRIDPARTSITRVEAAGDLKSATVYVSVAGDEKQRNKTMAALTHAAGYLQDKLKEKANLQFTPVLDFRFDLAFKKTMETLKLLSEVGKELRDIDSQRAATVVEEDSVESTPARRDTLSADMP